jgi:hypothetical protein
MATKKFTVTLLEDQLARVRDQVGERGMSAYVGQAVQQRLDRDETITALHDRYGRPSDKAMAWARRTAGLPAEPGDEPLLAEIETDRAQRWGRAG